MDDVIKQCGIMFAILVVFDILYPVKAFPKESCYLRSIKEIATRDLTVLGSYDIFLEHSLRTRLVSIWKRLRCHSNLTVEEIESLLNTWYAENCYDPDRKIEYILHKVNKDFYDMCNSSSDISSKWSINEDLPMAPRTLLFNDYIDVESLDKLYYDVIKVNKEVAL